IESGTSVSDWTSWMVRARIAGSSARGIPALTSSMWAPAATWAIASRSTRLKSPLRISSARSFRPVGLIRSPMTTNGRSKPRVTSRVADETVVWVTLMPRSRRPVLGRRPVEVDAAGGDEAGQDLAGVLGVEAGRLGVGDRLDVIAAGPGFAAPLLDVIAGAALAGL